MNKPSPSHVCGRDCDFDADRGCPDAAPCAEPLDEVDPDYTIDEEDADLLDELMSEGYSESEARRMIGDANDEICYGFDDLDRDMPEWADEEEDE